MVVNGVVVGDNDDKSIVFDDSYFFIAKTILRFSVVVLFINGIAGCSNGAMVVINSCVVS